MLEKASIVPIRWALKGRPRSPLHVCYFPLISYLPDHLFLLLTMPTFPCVFLTCTFSHICFDSLSIYSPPFLFAKRSPTIHLCYLESELLCFNLWPFHKSPLPPSYISASTFYLHFHFQSDTCFVLSALTPFAMVAFCPFYLFLYFLAFLLISYPSSVLLFCYLSLSLSTCYRSVSSSPLPSTCIISTYWQCISWHSWGGAGWLPSLHNCNLKS